MNGAEVLKSSLIYLVGRVGGNAITFGALIAYSWLFEPGPYGLFSVVNTIALQTHFILSQWLCTSVNRFMPANLERRETVLTTTLTGFAIVLAFTALSAGGASLFAGDRLITGEGGVERRLSTLILFGLPLFFAYAYTELNITIFQTSLQPGRYAKAFVGRSAFAAIATVLLALAGLGMEALVLGVLIGNLIPTVLTAREIWGRVRWRFFDRTLLVAMFSFGLPLSASLVLRGVMGSVDRFMLAGMSGVAQAGLYSFSYDIAAKSLIVLMSAAHLASFPLVLRAFEEGDRQKTDKIILSNIRLILFLTLPVGTAMAVLSPWLVALFGDEYRVIVSQLLPWMAVCAILSGLQSFHFAQAFAIRKRPVDLLYVFAGGAVINVVFNLLWIPQHGALGAAAASVLANAVALILSWELGKRRYDLPFPVRDLGKLILACALAAVVVWPARSSGNLLWLAFSLVSAGGVFLATVYLMDYAGARQVVQDLRAKGFQALRPKFGQN